MDKNIW